MPTAVAEQSVQDLDALNAMIEEKSDPQTIVDWAVAMFGPQDIVMSSSFGAESAMLLHMATRIVPDIKIIFVDTGYLFPETHQFMEQLRRRFNLNVWTYRTMQEPIAWLAKNNEPDPTVRQNRDVCCAVNKNEPFERAMAELRPKAWLRGVRRDQTDERKTIRFVQWDRRFKCYAVSPLLNQSRQQIYAYLKQHNLPYHPLFDRGYASIGCNPLSCTRPIQIGEDARAGRWAGSDKIECGINVDKNSLDSAQI